MKPFCIFFFILNVTIVIFGDQISDLEQKLNYQIQLMKKDFENKMSNYKQEIDDRFKNNEQSTCDRDWISYSDRKCFKIFEKKGSETEAKKNCSQLDSSSTLITIQSQNEQNFISNHLKNYKNISDFVWIGLEFIDKSFQWMDGNNLTFENWDENAVKDGSSKCVQMSLTEAELGKWTDELCQKKYLIVCQKKQSTKSVLSEEIKNITNVIEKQQISIKVQHDSIEKQQTSIDSHENSIKKQQEQLNSIIPLGFLYTQLPNQPAPQELWPNMKWTEVSDSYSGVFFRVIGQGSAEFGQIQKDSSPRLSQIFSGYIGDHINEIYFFDQSVNVQKGSWSGWVRTGHTSDDKSIDTKFYVSNDEVCPRNMAVKIWKRSG